MEEKRYYTVDEVAEILGINRVTVYGLIKKQEFHSVNIGGKYRISKKGFDAWFDGDVPEPEKVR